MTCGYMQPIIAVIAYATVMLGMALTKAQESNSASMSEGNTVLVVSQNGIICSIIEASVELRTQYESESGDLLIDKVWPESVASCIRQAVRKVIRTRQSYGERLDDPTDGRSYEFIYIAQGPDRAMMIVRDQSDQQVALTRVHKLAFTDEATGLPNREFLLGELQKITDMQRLKEGRAALICIHVGQFDDHGWALNSSQQDEILKVLASRLTQHLRGTNDDDEEDYERYSVAARIDFRQFGIVLPSIESGEDAEAVVKRLITDLSEPVTTGARTVSVSPKFGVALFPQDGTDHASLFQNSAAAMNDARNDPASSFKFHSGTVRLRTLQRQDLEVELRTALENEDYALNYLPIVHASNGQPVTLEALLRWPDTVLGTQPTRKIVRVAERTGLIIPIGEWVIRSACNQLQQWRTAGFDEIRIAINLSSQELVSDGIVERIARILDETGVEAGNVDIELKEHMLFREVLNDYATCRQLKTLGMRMVIDDYGIGACSLAHLSQSPADAIKIDNSFVQNLEASNRDRAACAAAIAMANELGIEVIAEGVESEQQANILRDIGCRFLQGFYFSKPMDHGAASTYLSACNTALQSGGVIR